MTVSGLVPKLASRVWRSSTTVAVKARARCGRDGRVARTEGVIMPTIMVDDADGCMMGVRLPPPPDFVPPTIAESLARGFDRQAEFYVCEGKLFVVWPDWDYAEDWSKHPIREVHPFHPVIHGDEITEAEFRALVAERHSLP
jgi:hypothetical protein